MKVTPRLQPAIATLCFVLCLLTACREQRQAPLPDHPRLTPKVAFVDVNFFSSALQRDMPYRVVLPFGYAERKQILPVVYLLHGGGGGFRDWTNYSDVAHYAEQGLILVMPEGESSYYMNSTGNPQDRYEDYIVKDLIADVEKRFPASNSRNRRAIIGVSMGGYGAIVLALKHPGLFALAAGLSPALDVPTRPFSIKRISQWRRHRSIFGAWNGKMQQANDPYPLARAADPGKTPYIFLSCGRQEGLLPANRKFASILQQRQLAYEFHIAPGGHDWNQWNQLLPRLFETLADHLNTNV